MSEQPVISIRYLEATEHFYRCQELQRQVWGMSDEFTVPAHLLITAQKNGGLVLGAFTASGEMVGFLFGFLGMANGRLKHCSHMVGVLPEYRAHGIGYQLKLAQRQHTLTQGVELVTWTFDPLESMNANLNVCKLGVVCRTYLRDVYGRMDTGMHAGLNTDRFEVEWWVATRRVAERVERGGHRPSLAALADEGAQVVNPARFDATGQLRPGPADLTIATDTVLVEIPANAQAIKGSDLALAAAWRAQTREVMEHYFAAGYTLAEFASEVQAGARRSYYVLKRDFEVE